MRAFGALPFILVASILGAALGGCAGPIYSDREIGSAASISPKSTWRVAGDFRDMAAATDSNISTAATTAVSYDGAKLTIDLGRRCLYNMIVLDQGPRDQMSYCRRISVLISNDGVNFYQVYSAAGTRRITYCPLLTPTMSRYIRLVATVPGDKPWSIAEIYME